MNKLYRNTVFLTSAAKLNQSPSDAGFEIAFAGRSNAGKSSAINTLCDQKSLARTSKTPGRTQLLNFFTIDDERRIVDLPGYGFAKVSENIKRQWQGTLADYLEHRQCLQGIFLMMDCRHPLKDNDRQMLEWAAHIGLPVHILLTKADKLKKGPAKSSLLEVKKTIKPISELFTVQLFSSLKKTGIDTAHQKMNDWFALTST